MSERGLCVRRKRQSLSLAGLALLMAAVTGPAVKAETNRVSFPPELEALKHYTTVTRGHVTEHMLTTTAAIEAVKSGKEVPNGTYFVLADYRDGKIYRYFVMEKGEGWGDDYEPRRRTGDWQFQWFNADRSINLNENTARCQSCHQSQAGKDPLFTAGAILGSE